MNIDVMTSSLRHAAIALASIWLVASPGLARAASAVHSPRANPAFQRDIDAVRRERDPDEQGELEYRLFHDISRRPRVRYSAAQIDELAQMLQDKRVSDPYWIAASLGAIGPDARRAGPYLQAAFAQELCVLIAAHVRRRYGVTTIDRVEGSMLRLGLKPKPALCPSGPEPGAPMRYYDDPDLQQYLELNAHKPGGAVMDPVPTPPHPPAPDRS